MSMPNGLVPGKCATCGDKVALDRVCCPVCDSAVPQMLFLDPVLGGPGFGSSAGARRQIAQDIQFHGETSLNSEIVE